MRLWLSLRQPERDDKEVTRPTSEMVRVIGVDPGTAITGWGVVEGDGQDLAMLAGGVITTPAGMPLPQRLQVIYRELTTIVQQWQPETAAIEELFFSKNAKTALAVGHGR